MRTTRWKTLLSLLFAFALVAAACGSDDAGDETTDTTEADAGAGEDDTDTTEADAGDGEEDPEDDGEAMGDMPDLSGQTISVLTPETGAEFEGFQAGMQPFIDGTGVEIEYNSSRDASTELTLGVEGGNPPNIALIPQPGRTVQFAEAGDAKVIPADILADLTPNFDAYWFELVTTDAGVHGVPVKGDVKSLVWYSPATFEANGYAIPETWDDLEALTEQMKTDGIAPWCVGIGSGDATGWPWTDWNEDIMLRLMGPDVYDQWVNHEIPFNSPEVAEVTQFVADIWFEEGNVLGGRDAIAATGFQEAGLPVLSGDCGLHRQANFYAAQFVDNGAVIGEDVDIFYLPTISDEFGTVVLGAGVHAVPFTEDEATMAAIAWMASAEFADARIAADFGGFLSPNTAHDVSGYSADLDRSLAEILVSADPFRFDASDLMPGEVGAGSFWTDGTDYVSGAIEQQAYLDNVEASWP